MKELRQAILDLKVATSLLTATVQKCKRSTFITKITDTIFYTSMAVMGCYIGYSLAVITVTLLSTV